MPETQILLMLEDVKDEQTKQRLAIEKLAVDFLRLTASVRDMNRYSQRIGTVEDVCKDILAPSPDIVRANESLAEIQGSGRREFGALQFIVADWDEKWQYNFSFRFENGISDGLIGFDLRPGTPGHKALLDAVESLRIAPNAPGLDMSAPAPADPGTLSRRIVYKSSPPVEKSS